MAADYSPFQPDIFERLTQGETSLGIDRQDWFVEALAENYAAIAERYGCALAISRRRALEAQKYWLQDMTRIFIDGESTEPEPNHLKQAGFLAYWLRRRMVVDSSWETESTAVAVYQDDFLQYTNEWLAFLLGFQLCLYFECDPRKGDPRSRQLAQYKLDPEYIKDTVVLMNHKNVSPHAMYMIYRSLFYPFRL